MSVDKYLVKRYDREAYNCLHFAREVWLDETGVDIGPLLRESSETPRSFRQLEKPQSPCLVLMRDTGHTPHVGIFLRDRVLHIHEFGVEFIPLSSLLLQFKSAKFYNVLD